MNRNELKETALGGIINNPVFVLVLGTCPTIAKSDTVSNGIGIGTCYGVRPDMQQSFYFSAPQDNSG